MNTERTARFIRLALLLLVIPAALSVFGCSDGKHTSSPADEDGVTDGDQDVEREADAEPETTAAELVEQGVYWLENAENGLASKAFKSALDLDPNNANARFGYALSESFIGVEILGMVGQAIKGGLKPSFPEPASYRLAALADGDADPDPYNSGDYGDFNEWILSDLHRIFEMIGGHFTHAAELYKPIKGSAEVHLHFTHLPIYFGLKETGWLKGDLDGNDVYVFSAMANLMGQLFDFLNSGSFRGDLGSVVTSVMGGDLKVDFPRVMGLATFLLNDSPDFLAKSADSAARMAAVQTAFDTAFADLLAAYDTKLAIYTAGKQGGSKLFYIKKNTKGDKLLVMAIYKPDADGVGVKGEVNFLSPTEKTAMETLRAHVKDGGDPVGMKEVVLPAICSPLALAVGFGLLDALGLDLGLPAGSISPTSLANLASGILNLDLFALDLHTYFAAPFALRAVLPVWTGDRARYDNRFVMEWECPEETADDGYPNGSAMLLCAGDATSLVDAAHFTGQSYATLLDGQPLATPYIAWPNPSFDGALYVRAGSLNVPGYTAEPVFQKADTTTLNVALGKVIKGVMNYVSKDKR